MRAMASLITGVSIVCSNVCSCTDQRKHQSFASLAFGRDQRWPVDSSHKGPVTRKMFPFDDVIMLTDMYESTCHYLNQWWPSLMTPICVARSWWIKRTMVEVGRSTTRWFLSYHRVCILRVITLYDVVESRCFLWLIVWPSMIACAVLFAARRAMVLHC